MEHHASGVVEANWYCCSNAVTYASDNACYCRATPVRQKFESDLKCGSLQQRHRWGWSL